GTMLGSFLSGRLADRVPRYRLISTTLPLAVAAGALNMILVLVSPTLPWAIIGPVLLACAIGTAFPVLNLDILDLFPDHRGAAASMCTFASLIFNAALAGALVPLVATSMLNIALIDVSLSALSVLGWWWHLRTFGTQSFPAPA